jgi:hypothetical protein
LDAVRSTELPSSALAEHYLAAPSRTADAEFVAHELAPAVFGADAEGPRQRLNQRVAAALNCDLAAVLAATAQEGRPGNNPGLSALKRWRSGKRHRFHPATRNQEVRARHARKQLEQLVDVSPRLSAEATWQVRRQTHFQLSSHGQLRVADIVLARRSSAP